MGKEVTKTSLEGNKKKKTYIKSFRYYEHIIMSLKGLSLLNRNPVSNRLIEDESSIMGSEIYMGYRNLPQGAQVLRMPSADILQSNPHVRNWLRVAG